MTDINPRSLFSYDESIALLNTLIFLSKADGNVAEEEASFIVSFMEEFSLSNEDMRKAGSLSAIDAAKIIRNLDERRKRIVLSLWAELINVDESIDNKEIEMLKNMIYACDLEVEQNINNHKNQIDERKKDEEERNRINLQKQIKQRQKDEEEHNRINLQKQIKQRQKEIKKNELAEIKRAEEAKREEEQRIRDTVSRIVTMYELGYDYYVNEGVIPRYTSYYMNLDNCRKIISKETDIKYKHNEICRKRVTDTNNEELEKQHKVKQNVIAEQKRAEEAERRAMARAIEIRKECKEKYTLPFNIGIVLLFAAAVLINVENGFLSFVFGIFGLPFFIAGLYYYNDGPVNLSKIEEYKRNNPNDPAIRYL